MTTDNWKTEYESLIQFISDHSEIVLNKSEISIPQEVRDEFYSRFDAVRKNLVQEYYSNLPTDVETLGSNYRKVEKEILERLKLESIAMPTDLFSFLHAPKEGLERVFYSGLFDLLQGKTTLDEFEHAVPEDFNAAAADLFRLGYEFWASLTLINELEPDQAFAVDLDEDYKPFLNELKSIAFGRQAHHPTIRIPEFVIHSSKVDKFIAVKMALAREIETYVVQYRPPVRPRKRTGDTSHAMDSRAMILSVLPNPKEIPILAEIYDRTINSPDMIIEFVTTGDLENPDAVEEVKRHFESLHPNLGVCLLVMDPGRVGSREFVSENVTAYDIGFDPSKLHPVTARLA